MDTHIIKCYLTIKKGMKYWYIHKYDETKIFLLSERSQPQKTTYCVTFTILNIQIGTSIGKESRLTFAWRRQSRNRNQHRYSILDSDDSCKYWKYTKTTVEFMLCDKKQTFLPVTWSIWKNWVSLFWAMEIWGCCVITEYISLL